MTHKRKRADIGDAEMKARRANDEPWEPLPGMVKRRCLECEFWCAFDVRDRRPPVCPDCRFLQASGKSYGGRHLPSE